MDGPAIGMEPLCAVATVAAVKPAEPPIAAIEPTRAAATANLFSRPAETASTSAPSTPPASIVQASQLCQPEASRSIRYQPQTAVPAIISASPPRARCERRRCHNWLPPIATSAPMPGQGDRVVGSRCDMNEKTTMVTISQLPHKISPARSGPYEGRRDHQPGQQCQQGRGDEPETCEPKPYRTSW